MGRLHYLAVALGAVIAASQSVATSLPEYAGYCHAIAAVAGSILPVLAVVTGSALAPKVGGGQ